MAQLPLFQPPSWTVSDLTRYLRVLFESDEALQDLWVQGEVSNLSRPTSGHLYFTLKDAGASLRCVMWRNAVIRQAFLPRDGEAVEVHGGISAGIDPMGVSTVRHRCRAWNCGCCQTSSIELIRALAICARSSRSSSSVIPWARMPPTVR